MATHATLRHQPRDLPRPRQLCRRSVVPPRHRRNQRQNPEPHRHFTVTPSISCRPTPFPFGKLPPNSGKPLFHPRTDSCKPEGSSVSIPSAGPAIAMPNLHNLPHKQHLRPLARRLHRFHRGDQYRHPEARKRKHRMYDCLTPYYTHGPLLQAPGNHSPWPNEPPPQIILGWAQKPNPLADKLLTRGATSSAAFLPTGGTELT